MISTRKNITGLLSGEEYLKRYSETLLNDASALLNEKEEIEKYFDSQQDSYNEEIKTLTKQFDVKLQSSTRIIVTIIARQEGKIIYNTLRQYLNQNLSPGLFQIIVLNNHFIDKNKDKTEEEIKRFVSDNPSINVSYVYKIWKDKSEACGGNARKHVFDIALNLLKKHDAKESETIIVSHDADPISYKDNYLSSIVHKFDTNPQIDALVTPMARQENAMMKPNVLVPVELIRLMEIEMIKERTELDEPADPAIFAGANYAMRASILAASGGCNPRAKINADRELGWIMANARKWDPERIVILYETEMVTDARRFVDAIASGLPADLMIFNYNPNIGNMEEGELLNMISDDIDWELLEEDINSTWHSQNTGNKLYAKKFAPAFTEAMKILGIDYSLVNGLCVLNNVDSLQSKLSSRYGRDVGIVHSKPIVYTEQMIKDIKDFFGSLSEGVIEARFISTGR